MRKSFDVKFISNGGADELKINGSGNLIIYEDGIEITGTFSKRFTTPKEVKYLVNIEKIVNVIRTDETIFFQIYDEEHGTLNCSFNAGESSVSMQIESLLPTVITEEFKKQVFEIHDFTEKLFKITPNAYISNFLVKLIIGIFILMVINGVGFLNPSSEGLIKWGSNVSYLTSTGQWWRLFTCMFIHIGIIHLMFNMWVLRAIGPLVERLFGNPAFLIIFLFSGVCGSLNSTYWHPNGISAGASAAIFGIAGALISYIIVYGKSIPMEIFKELRSSFLSFIIINLIFGAAITWVDNSAHIGGLIGGFVMGYILAMPLDIDARRKKFGMTIFKGIVVSFVITSVLWSMIPKYTGEFQLTLKWFAEEERVANEQFKKHITALRDQPGKSIEVAGLIKKDCFLRWSEVVDRFSKLKIPVNNALYQRWELTLKFAQIQKDSMDNIIQGLEYNDPKKLNKFKDLQNQAKQIITEMKNIIK